MAAKRKSPASLEDALAGRDPDVDTIYRPPLKLIDTHAKATVYMPKAALKRLKQMALDNDKKVNDYLMEAVDLMFAKYGQPSLAEYEKK